MGNVKPITPDEVVEHKLREIPDQVVECWNRMIASKSNGSNTITIMQDDIVSALVAATGVKRQAVFDLGWLDIEDLYRNAGWKVSYDKPGYNESYEAYFEFRKK